jgi:hypothetical protein
MDLEWYLFEHSYLLDIQIMPMNNRLILRLDAKMTYDHPRAGERNTSGKGFVEIEMAFEGAQYLKMLNSPNLINNPNEDIGSIESLCVDDFHCHLSHVKVGKSSTNTRLKWLTFVSEMISLELVFERFVIREK